MAVPKEPTIHQLLDTGILLQDRHHQRWLSQSRVSKTKTRRFHILCPFLGSVVGLLVMLTIGRLHFSAGSPLTHALSYRPSPSITTSLPTSIGGHRGVVMWYMKGSPKFPQDYNNEARCAAPNRHPAQEISLYGSPILGSTMCWARFCLTCFALSRAGKIFTSFKVALSSSPGSSSARHN